MKKSLEDQAEALTEIHARRRETSCRDKEQGSDGEDSLEVTNSSIKQTQNIRGCVNGRRDERCVNGYRGDECQNHDHAETKSSESRRARAAFGTADGKEKPRMNRNEHRGWDKRTNLKLTGRTRRERNTETRTRRTRRRSKPRNVRISIALQ